MRTLLAPSRVLRARNIVFAIVIGAMSLAAGATTASAQNPTAAGYGETPVVPSDPGGSTLPFTGTDVGLTVLAALIVLTVGVILRRGTQGKQGPGSA